MLKKLFQTRQITPSPTTEWLFLILVLFTTLLLSISRFDNGWVWDDIDMFVKRDFVFHLENIPALFSHNTMHVSDGGKFATVSGLDTYRPLTLLTFMFDAAWGGRRPFPFHVTGLLLHLGVVALVWVHARRILSPHARQHAWLAALFFGIHPLLVEAHVWINGRSDTLCTLFVLLAMWLYPTASTEKGTGPLSWGRRVGIFILFLSALLCKEVALFILPPLFLWQAGFFHSQPLRMLSALQRLLPTLTASTVYFILRINALGGLKTSGGSEHIIQAIVRLPYYVLDSIVRLILPIKTAPRFVMEAYAHISVVWILLAWIAGVTVLAAIWLFRKREPLFNFALVWYICALSPAVMIASLAWYGFGRYLYLPMTMLVIGIFDFAIGIWNRKSKSRILHRFLLLTGIQYFILNSFITIRAVRDYRDPSSFYQAIIRDYPDRSHGYGGAGRLLIEAEAYKPAILLLRKAIDIAPPDSRHWNNLAQAYFRAGDLKSAGEIAKLAIRRFPRKPKFYHILAASMAASDPEVSIQAALTALQLDPKRTVTWSLLRELVTRHPRRTELAAALRRHALDPLHVAYQKKLLQLLQKNPG